MSLITLLRVAAFIGAFIWTLYLIPGWNAYSDMARFFPSQSKILQDAQNSLIIQSCAVIGLMLFGFLVKDKSEENKKITQSHNQSQVTRDTRNEFDGVRALDNDAYKIFLTKKYKIEKSEVLSKFILLEKLFDTIDSALEYAHETELNASQNISDGYTSNIEDKFLEEKSKKKTNYIKFTITMTVVMLLIIFFSEYIFPKINSSTTSTAPKISKENGGGYSSVVQELDAEGWTSLRNYVDFKYYKYSSVQYDAPFIEDYINQSYPERVRQLRVTQCAKGNKNPPACNGKNSGYRIILDDRNISRLEADMKRDDNKQVGD